MTRDVFTVALTSGLIFLLFFGFFGGLGRLLFRGFFGFWHFDGLGFVHLILGRRLGGNRGADDSLNLVVDFGPIFVCHGFDLIIEMIDQIIRGFGRVFLEVCRRGGFGSLRPERIQDDGEDLRNKREVFHTVFGFV